MTDKQLRRLKAAWAKTQLAAPPNNWRRFIILEELSRWQRLKLWLKRQWRRWT